MRLHAKYFIAVFVCIVLLLAGFLIWRRTVVNESESNSPHKLRIVTTLFPMYDMVRAIGGTEVSIMMILPPGVEAHGFEPKVGDLAAIQNADLFIYTSDSMEPWVHDVIQTTQKSSTQVLMATEGLSLQIRNEESHEGESAAEHDSHEDGEMLDPHVWLDLGRAQDIARAIANRLVELDPKNASLYRRRLAAWTGRAETLDVAYVESLASCSERTVVHAGHFSFGYLMDRYDLRYEALQGYSPDSEPTPARLAALIQLIRDGNIKTIFAEELVSPRFAESLAQETGVKIEMLHTAHNLSAEDRKNSVTYFAIMERNLAALTRGLACQ